MESTGVYWIPLFQILEARGFQVFLDNAHHVTNVPGRKSDVSDPQWLQYLHSVGLLRASFRPEQAVCTVRSILRHRDGLVQMASSHVQHMQKALDQMNLQLHHVISDITGVTGIAILEAILVLLCYKKGAPQKGQPESCRSRTLAMVCRRVAMDQGLCRSTRTGRTPRPEVAWPVGDG